ncbi:hypothetical protein GQ42DRAFT_158671 [Ramicandelaber brevisporus]|nr:hypothetical protein GQ42DRAFT_158671 [Ramicandelaber brevisporus]
MSNIHRTIVFVAQTLVLASSVAIAVVSALWLTPYPDFIINDAAAVGFTLGANIVIALWSVWVLARLFSARFNKRHISFKKHLLLHHQSEQSATAASTAATAPLINGHPNSKSGVGANSNGAAEKQQQHPQQLNMEEYPPRAPYTLRPWPFTIISFVTMWLVGIPAILMRMDLVYNRVNRCSDGVLDPPRWNMDPAYRNRCNFGAAGAVVLQVNTMLCLVGFMIGLAIIIQYDSTTDLLWLPYIEYVAWLESNPKVTRQSQQQQQSQSVPVQRERSIRAAFTRAIRDRSPFTPGQPRPPISAPIIAPPSEAIPLRDRQQQQQQQQRSSGGLHAPVARARPTPAAGGVLSAYGARATVAPNVTGNEKASSGSNINSNSSSGNNEDAVTFAEEEQQQKPMSSMERNRRRLSDILEEESALAYSDSHISASSRRQHQ